MIVRRFYPLQGERVAKVAPAIERDVEGTWKRRLRLFSGRTLSGAALTLEQNARAGLAASLNQFLSWGIVEGLEASLHPETENGAVRHYVEVNSGMGIAPGGEEIVLPEPLQVELKSIPGLGTAGAKFGFLVLEPVEARLLGEAYATDQCDYDESKDAFSDWQLIDGCRLKFLEWAPDELGPVPAGPAARNRAAYTIFAKHSAFTPEETSSWEEKGVPLGLLSVGADGAPVFLDRYSLVRDGGRPRRRTDLIPGAGHPILWQARLLQFSEQITETDPGGKENPFAFLPPAGLLPREWFDLQFSDESGLELQQRFFPLHFDFVAAPVPIEQLDAAIEASAGFLPIDMGRRERVEILVPVPQVFFEPELLEAEQVDHRFYEAVRQAVERRADWLGHRQRVRGFVSQATRAVTGKDAEFPARDPNQIDPNESTNPNPPADPKDTPVDLAKLLADNNTALEGILLRVFRDPEVTKKRTRQLASLGLARAAQQLDMLADRGDDLINVGFIRVQADMYRVRQILLGGTAETRLAISPALAGIAESRTAIAREDAISKALQEMTESRSDAIVKRSPARVRIPTPADYHFDLAGVELPAVGGEERTASAVFSVVDTVARKTPAMVVTSEAVTETTVKYGAAVERLRGSTIVKSAETYVEVKAAVEETVEPARTPAAGRRVEAAYEAVEVTTQPIPGRQEIRTTTTEERIRAAKGPEARDFALSTKYAVVNSMKNTPFAIAPDSEPDKPLLKLSDVFAALLIPALGVWQARDGGGIWVFEKDGQVERNLRRENKLLGALDQPAIARILEEPDDQGITDEAHYFYAAVDILEGAIGALRGAEGFIEALRQAAAQCRSAAQALADAIIQFQDRLAEIEDEIAEARQDVAVATALLAEEEQRVALINARRRRVIEEYVPFLCFRRPPTVTSLRQVPARNLDPEVLAPPVPVCLARNLTPPVELLKLIDILREAPVFWFPRIEALLARLDRREDLRDALRQAIGRLGGKVSAVLDDRDFLQISSGRFGTALGNVLSAQREVTVRYRNLLPQVDPEVVYRLTWRESFLQCRRVLSIGDLVDGVGGRSDLSRLAGQELDQIARVCACLYEKFAAEVLPEIRLDWALRYSQYDIAIDFSDLSLLPRWSEIDYLDRHDLQTYVDWLFSQIDRNENEAVEAINNLVRVSILLASHAPVNRLIQGEVDEPGDVEEGGSAVVSFNADILMHVRRGMELHVVQEQKVVATAIIDDLLDRRAQIRITQNLTQQAVLKLDRTMRVQWVANAEQSAIVRELIDGTASRTQAVLAATQK